MQTIVHIPQNRDFIHININKTALGKGLASPELRKQMGNYPQLGIKTQKSIPNAELVELKGIGHMPHIEDFDTFIKNVLNFLSKD